MCYLQGWRVGCNPPFVLGGIRLIGLPAPLGRFLTGVCLPFPLAGRPFHRFHFSILNNLACIIGNCWMDVSFLLRCQGSRLTPLRVLQFYLWAEFPQASHGGSKATRQLRQPKMYLRGVGNKNFGNLILLHAFFYA